MKLLDRIWSMLGLIESDEAPETQPGEKTPERNEKKSDRPQKAVEEPKYRRPPQTEETPAAPTPVPPTPAATAPVAKAPPIPSKTVSPVHMPKDPASNKGRVIILQPTGFDDARQIAENLTNGLTVFVNFERTDGDTTKRTVDFMSGITYAVGGTVQRISNALFLFAPSNVEIFSSERVPDEETGALPWRRP